MLIINDRSRSVKNPLTIALGSFRRVNQRLNKSPKALSAFGIYDDLKFRLSNANVRKPLVSFCTTIKDRFEHLQETLPKNIADNEKYSNCEFVILDYDCPDPRTRDWFKTKMMHHIESGKVKYFYYPDTPLYDASHSRNLAFRLSAGEILCSLDADNYTGSRFAEYISHTIRTRDVYLQGPKNGLGLHGRICVRRFAWKKIGGYDERMRGFGGEDRDFSSRLAMADQKKKLIRIGRHNHSIQHTDELRVRHFDMNKKDGALYNDDILSKNSNGKIICPNDGKFGHGKVEKNFKEWIEV